MTIKSTKTILITGGNSGIGEQTAYQFAGNGDKVLITYYQDKEAAERVVEKCQALGAKEVQFFYLDLKNNQNIENLAKEVKEKYGSLDILINNAGAKTNALLEEQTFVSIEEQVRTNLEGMIKLTREFITIIRFSVINIGSALALEGAKKNLTVYCAAKYGVRGFTKSLAREYPHLKIYTVNPNLTATQMGHFKGMEPGAVAEIIFKAAMGKYCAKPGSDINVLDYRYGSFVKHLLPILRFLKRVVKFFFNHK